MLLAGKERENTAALSGFTNNVLYAPKTHNNDRNLNIDATRLFLWPFDQPGYTAEMQWRSKLLMKFTHGDVT
jgi:hypothetical protein